MACLRFHSDFQRGLTPEREITRTRKKKNVCQVLFHEESKYEISKPYHAWFSTNGQTGARTDARTDNPKTNMPRQLLRSWGHNYSNS